MSFDEFRREHRNLFRAIIAAMLFGVGWVVLAVAEDQVADLAKTLTGPIETVLTWMHERKHWAYPLYGLALSLIIFFADTIKGWFRKEPPSRDLRLEAVLDYLLETKNLKQHYPPPARPLLTLIQQAARDGKLTVHARVGHAGSFYGENGVFEQVEASVFADHGFHVGGDDWAITTAGAVALYDPLKMYYDPYFNQAEIIAFYKQLRRTLNTREDSRLTGGSVNNRPLTIVVGAIMVMVICNLALTFVWQRETIRELRMSRIAAEGAESGIQNLSSEIDEVKQAVKEATDYLDARLEETDLR